MRKMLNAVFEWLGLQPEVLCSESVCSRTAIESMMETQLWLIDLYGGQQNAVMATCTQIEEVLARLNSVKDAVMSDMNESNFVILQQELDSIQAEISVYRSKLEYIKQCEERVAALHNRCQGLLNRCAISMANSGSTCALASARSDLDEELGRLIEMSTIEVHTTG